MEPASEPNATQIDTVRIKFIDGTEGILPVHGISQLQVLRVLDEVGIKSWRELQTKEPSLEAIRFMQKIAAMALTFKGQAEAWTVERIQNSFADVEQVTKVFVKSVQLAQFTGRPSEPAPNMKKKHGPYG